MSDASALDLWIYSGVLTPPVVALLVALWRWRFPGRERWGVRRFLGVVLFASYLVHAFATTVALRNSSGPHDVVDFLVGFLDPFAWFYVVLFVVISGMEWLSRILRS